MLKTISMCILTKAILKTTNGTAHSYLESNLSNKQTEYALLLTANRLYHLYRVGGANYVID